MIGLDVRLGDRTNVRSGPHDALRLSADMLLNDGHLQTKAIQNFFYAEICTRSMSRNDYY
ncbi:hypothetical protein [Stenotrophomonas acidaminiphila]|uniref:hypothetical protein n=1 Tax=Stenotrophomonas acidaminiphila TaxID=128780 RepID=UPI0020C6A356|nr:hypothetical protein [Stenotrophomonas acidaminiphila]